MVKINEKVLNILTSGPGKAFDEEGIHQTIICNLSIVLTLTFLTLFAIDAFIKNAFFLFWTELSILTCQWVLFFYLRKTHSFKIVLYFITLFLSLFLP